MIRPLTNTALALLLACGSLAAADKGEKTLTLDQLPGPVKATLLAQAKGAALTEIEQKTKKGQVLFEAEAVVDGKKLEFTVAADGTLLKTEVDDGKDDGDDKGDKGKKGQDAERKAVVPGVQVGNQDF